MRQSHRLAVSWDIVFDPATLMFLVGGLAWITIDAGRLKAGSGERGAWSKAPLSCSLLPAPCSLLSTLGRFVLVVFAWLPIRAVVVLALYLHRAGVSEAGLPLHVMNQFFSPWVLLVMLAPAILLAWCWVPLLGNAPLPPGKVKEDVAPAAHSRPRAAVFQADTTGSLSVSYLAAATCCLFGAILVALGLQWEPIGARKAGRVKIVEKHSPWSPSDFPYNTEVLGGGPDENRLRLQLCGRLSISQPVL